MKTVKKSSHIRIYEERKPTWNKYCKLTGLTSPQLMDKILFSDELKLDKRMKIEAIKKIRELS